MRPRQLFQTARRGRHQRELQLHPQHLSAPRYVRLSVPTQLGREGARGLHGAEGRSCFPGLCLVLQPVVRSELSDTQHWHCARATCPLPGYECSHGTPSECATTCGVGSALLGTHPHRLELHKISTSLHDDGVLRGVRCAVCAPPMGQHPAVWGEPPSTAALLHLSHGSALEWEKECELEELRPPAGGRGCPERRIKAKPLRGGCADVFPQLH